MSLLDDLRLNDTASNDATRTEREMMGGGLPEEGIHHAVFNGHREGSTPNTGSRYRELTFVILAGPSKGMSVKETVWLPNGEDATKDEKKTQRLRLFCHRLGLLKKTERTVTENGKQVKKSVYEPVEGKMDLVQCTGAEVLVDVQHEEDVVEKDGKTKKYKRAKLTYEGVIPLDDKRGEKVARGNPADVANGMLSAPSGSGGGGGGGGPVSPPATAGKGSRDFSDLM